MKVLSITGPSAIGSSEDQAYALVDLRSYASIEKEQERSLSGIPVAK